MYTQTETDLFAFSHWAVNASVISSLTTCATKYFLFFCCCYFLHKENVSRLKKMVHDSRFLCLFSFALEKEWEKKTVWRVRKKKQIFCNMCCPCSVD